MTRSPESVRLPHPRSDADSYSGGAAGASPRAPPSRCRDCRVRTVRIPERTIIDPRTRRPRTVTARTFQATDYCPAHAPPKPPSLIRATVNAPPPETREAAIEEFFSWHRAHNGRRRRDPTEWIEVVDVRRDGGGWEIDYRVERGILS